MCSKKTKALISCAVTAQLICVFVFPCAKCRFSNEGAHIQFFNLPFFDVIFQLRRSKLS